MSLKHDVLATSLSLSRRHKPQLQMRHQQHQLVSRLNVVGGRKLPQNHRLVSHVIRPESTTNVSPLNYADSLMKDLELSEGEKMKTLEEKVRGLIDEEMCGSDVLPLLELVDDIENLGLGYRFKTEIRRALEKVESAGDGEESLHTVSLRFKLLRQHGFHVTQDSFQRFKDNDGSFRGCLNEDVWGLLSLYEASYLAFEEETDLSKAKSFAIEQIKKLTNEENKSLMEYVNYTLDLPVYRRMLRLHVYWYIQVYGKRKDANHLLLELAILDFNMAQLIIKGELQNVSRWWESTGLSSKLGFMKYKPMEYFLWNVGLVFQPQYSTCRISLTKETAFITAIDDIYDIYGSIDELELFTDAVKRWDIGALKHMPEDLQISFQALYNTVNEIAYDPLRQKGGYAIPILQKSWGELLGALLVEAKWTHKSYIPSFEEYLDNGWRSASGVVLLTHAYFLMNQESKTDLIESLDKFHDLLKWPSMILRLCNDLATSSDELTKGKTANAISCYMHEKGVSEEVAREYIETLIDVAWRKTIKARVFSSKELEDDFTNTAINLARVSLYAYQYGHTHGDIDVRTKERVLAMLTRPLSITG